MNYFLSPCKISLLQRYYIWDKSFLLRKKKIPEIRSHYFAAINRLLKKCVNIFFCIDDDLQRYSKYGHKKGKVSWRQEICSTYSFRNTKSGSIIFSKNQQQQHMHLCGCHPLSLFFFYSRLKVKIIFWNIEKAAVLIYSVYSFRS